MKSLRWRFIRYKNIVYFKGGQQLYGVDLERKNLTTLIENLPCPIVGFDFYDPNARVMNGPKKYRQLTRGLINNPRLLLLTTDGRIWEYDVDSDGSRLKLNNNKTKLSSLQQATWHYICVCSQYIAVSQKDNKGKRAILLLDRIENKLVYTINLPDGIFN